MTAFLVHSSVRPASSFLPILLLLFACSAVAAPLVVNSSSSSLPASHVAVSAAAACDPCSAAGCGGVVFPSTPPPTDTTLIASGGTYYFQLCADTTACANSYPDGQVCLYSSSSYMSLGKHASATWSQPSSSSLLLSVSGGDEFWLGCYTNAASNVTVYCAQGTDTLSLVNAGARGQCNWQFNFDSSVMCAVHGSGGAGKGGLSGGSIFLIILLVLLVLYLVGGVLFNKYRRGATGSDLLPHKAFWLDLPGLVADGCRFTWQKLRALAGGARAGSLLSASTGSTYETI